MNPTISVDSLVQLPLFVLPDQGFWIDVRDGDERAFRLYQRHYSFYNYSDGRRDRYGYRNRRLIVGPGEKLVLLGLGESALCCWRRGSDASSKGELRVYCTVFRNESVQRASDILREAMAHAWRRWPGQKLWTYVDSNRILSRVPGYCFRRAGWKRVGFSKGGLLVFCVNPPR